MIIHTKYGDAELVVSNTTDEQGNRRTQYTDLMFNGDCIVTFTNKSLSEIEAFSNYAIKRLTDNCEYYIGNRKQLNDRKAAKEVLESMSVDDIYRFIVSLHSCEGAAQQNLYSFANRLT